MWVEVFLARDEAADKGSHDVVVQIPLPLVGVADEIRELHPLQVHVTAQGGKDVVKDRHFAAHLESFDMADLLDHSVVLLDVPMLVVQLLERTVPKGAVGIALRQENQVMAQLVF